MPFLLAGDKYIFFTKPSPRAATSFKNVSKSRIGVSFSIRLRLALFTCTIRRWSLRLHQPRKWMHVIMVLVLAETKRTWNLKSAKKDHSSPLHRRWGCTCLLKAELDNVKPIKLLPTGSYHTVQASPYLTCKPSEGKKLRKTPQLRPRSMHNDGY